MDGQIIIGTELDTSMLDSQIDLLTDKLQGLVEEYKALEEAEPFEDQQKQLIKLGSEIDTTRKKLDKLVGKKEELNKNEFEGLNSSIKGIGKGTDNLIRKIAKWSLAVIGIRSVYNGIRGAISTITQYDEGMAKQIEYIRFALANALKPVIEWIINAFFQLITLAGRFVYLLTGKNIFENSGVKDFEESMNKSAGSAKEIRKMLAGFDEMNVLEDTSSSSGGTSAGGSLDIPDLSEMISQETAIEKVTNDLINKWFELGETFEEGLANPQMFDEAYGYWSTFFLGIVQLAMGVWDAITGIIEVVGSVFDIIIGIFTGNEELISQGWKFFIDGLGRIFAGIAEIVVGVIKIIWGVIVGLLGEIWSGVQGLLTWIWDSLVSLWNGAVDIAGNAWEGIKNIFSEVASFFGDIFSKAWEAVKNVFSTGGRIFAGITEGILEAFKRIVNVIIDGINEVVAIPFRGINTALDALRGLDLWGWKPFEWIGLIDVPKIPRLARGGIVNNPGPGVMMGSYVAGERGPEAVIPLDEATLDRLGLAFARHTEINATVPVYIGNRQVAREIRRINAENDFAYNI